MDGESLGGQPVSILKNSGKEGKRRDMPTRVRGHRKPRVDPHLEIPSEVAWEGLSFLRHRSQWGEKVSMANKYIYFLMRNRG